MLDVGVWTLALSVALSGDRLEVAALAASLACSKSSPDAANSCTASVALDPAFERRVSSAAGFWRTMSNMVMVLEFLTVAQP